MNEQSEDRVYRLNTKAVPESKAGAEGKRIALDMIGCIWGPSKNAFTFDPKILATQLAKELPERNYTEQIIRENAEDIKTFFTVLPDGKWVPSPQYVYRLQCRPGAAS